MSEGHFEKGRWVEEPEPVSSSTGSDEDLPERVASAKASFGKGLDDLLAVGRELLTTEEGRRHIGKAMDKAGGEVMTTLEDAARSASEYISSMLEQKPKK